MFEQPGIGIDEMAWIQRDQFVYYVELAHALGDTGDWPRLRDDLLQALTAAFGLEVDQPDDPTRARDQRTCRQSRALMLLTEIRTRHDPDGDWQRFFDALWDARRRMRADL